MKSGRLLLNKSSSLSLSTSGEASTRHIGSMPLRMLKSPMITIRSMRRSATRRQILRTSRCRAPNGIEALTCTNKIRRAPARNTSRSCTTRPGTTSAQVGVSTDQFSEDRLLDKTCDTTCRGLEETPEDEGPRVLGAQRGQVAFNGMCLRDRCNSRSMKETTKDNVLLAW